MDFLIVVFVVLFGAALLLSYVRLALVVLVLVFMPVIALLQWLTGGKLLKPRAKRTKSTRELLDEKKKREQTIAQLKKFLRNPFRYLGTNPLKSAIETKHPPLPSTPQLSATRQCTQCGSSSLGERKVTSRATRAVDRTRRIARDFYAIHLYCKQCGVVLNDDLRGDIARAYLGLGDVRSSFDIDKKVAEVMQGARNLPEISDADVDNNFERVREVWGCLKVVTILERDLQSTVSRLIRGYAQEGFSDLQVMKHDQNFLQINFFLDSSFQGVRIARKAGGSFAAYGCPRMYRLGGWSQQRLDHRDGYVVTFLDEGEVAEGMSTSQVIRILGEPHRKITWGELLKDHDTVVGISADSPRLQDEFWLYQFDEFEYEITIQDGKVSEVNKKIKKK